MKYIIILNLLPAFCYTHIYTHSNIIKFSSLCLVNTSFQDISKEPSLLLAKSRTHTCIDVIDTRIYQ